MQPTYEFRWSNYDLERYLTNRRQVATQLRRDAELLQQRAQTVDEEADALQHALVLVLPPEQPTTPAQSSREGEG